MTVRDLLIHELHTDPLDRALVTKYGEVRHRRQNGHLLRAQIVCEAVRMYYWPDDEHDDETPVSAPPSRAPISTESRLRRALVLELLALGCFLVGFVGSDPHSAKTQNFVATVAIGGASLCASLFAVRHWLVRGSRQALWALRARALVALFPVILLVVGTPPILVVAFLAFGRESLGLLAAILTLVAEGTVILAARRHPVSRQVD